jgi:hypothetical protein
MWGPQKTRRDDAAAPLVDAPAVVARITSSLRTLEESRAAGVSVPSHVVFFLGALDRVLAGDERVYVAMCFGARKEQREEMTRVVVERAAVSRGAAIAAIRVHLESTLTDSAAGTVPRQALKFLADLRAGVLAKASRLA